MLESLDPNGLRLKPFLSLGHFQQPEGYGSLRFAQGTRLEHSGGLRPVGLDADCGLRAHDGKADAQNSVSCQYPKHH